MDVLTEEGVRIGASARVSLVPFCAAVCAYAILVAAAIAHHEAWVDEAQSWLLGRDASLFQLWTRLLHYEGTTGLWQTLLHVLAAAGLPYAAMNVFSGLLGLAAACVVIWRAPFPLWIRLALPFTFYLCYQYAVIARSYDLLPLLLFCCAATYGKANETPWLFAALLCLLAAVSVHGMLLAVTIACVTACRLSVRAYWRSLTVFLAAVLLLALAARPAVDGTFVSAFNFSFDHFVEVGARAFANAFTGEWISSILVVAFSIPLLWRGGGFLFFTLASLLLCGVASVIYAQVWHYGILFLAWLFAVWISWPKSDRVSHNLALGSLCIIIAIQGYWTVRSIAYDWDHAYSGSLDAARGLRELNLSGKSLYAIGFACIAIEPYFSRNIFANVNDGRPQAYWDWSRRNHVNLDSRRLAELQPDYVIVGYKNEFERGVWTGLVRKSGYQPIRHFEGNSFWHASIFETESYDLFARSTTP
jgi:hypothetical protein